MSYPSDALRFANRILKKLDCVPQSELLKGRPNKSISCPIANTIAAGIDAKYPREKLIEANESVDIWVYDYAANVCVQKWNGDEVVDACTLQILLPKGARGFVERFDAGKYPEFDLSVK